MDLVVAQRCRGRGDASSSKRQNKGLRKHSPPTAIKIQPMITLAACSAAAAGVIGAWHAARTSGFSSAEEAAVAALMAAARAGRVSELTETIEGGGVHVDARGEDGRTALAVCAAEGHAAAVRLLLSLGADHKAAVHHAAAAGHTAALHLLLVASSGEAAFTLRPGKARLRV